MRQKRVVLDSILKGSLSWRLLGSFTISGRAPKNCLSWVFYGRSYIEALNLNTNIGWAHVVATLWEGRLFQPPQDTPLAVQIRERSVNDQWPFIKSPRKDPIIHIPMNHQWFFKIENFPVFGGRFLFIHQRSADNSSNLSGGGRA